MKINIIDKSLPTISIRIGNNIAFGDIKSWSLADRNLMVVVA